MTGAGRHAVTPKVTGKAGHYLRIKLIPSREDADACQAVVLGEHEHESNACTEAGRDVLAGAERILLVKVVSIASRDVRFE